MFSLSPVYNLNAVLKATGIKADVLRAWERRYGLPMPQRTPAGHRLYSEQDIEMVKWLRARQTQGLSISRAVALWKEIVQAGRDPFSASSPSSPAPGPEVMPSGEDRLDWLRTEWLRASLAYDAVRAEAILSESFAVFPVETVLVRLLQRSLREIGRLWYEGSLTEQQEHFASGMAIRRLHALIAGAPHATRPQTVCLGCAPGELHTFPVDLLGHLLQRRGLAVLNLGADVPIDRLDQAVQAARPHLVILSAQTLATALPLQKAARSLQAHGTPLAFGGLVFSRVPGLSERIPAYFLGEDLEASVGAVEQLLLSPAPFPRVEPPGRTAPALAQRLRERQMAIELSVSKAMQRAGFRPETPPYASTFFTNGLAVALDLGNPAFLEPDLEWVRGLVASRQAPPDALEAYLEAYGAAVREELGEAARPILRWLSAHLTRDSHTSRQASGRA